MASITKKVRNRPVNEGDEIGVINREIVPVLLQVIDELGRISGDVTVTPSGTYNVVVTDFILFIQGGNIINLPDADLCKNKIVVIKNITASAPCFVITNDDAVIDGSGTKQLNNSYDCIVVVCDGENWWIIAEV